MDLDSAADELYGLPPGEFTAARDRLAGEARGAGDRDLAAAIKKLKRPTVAAWLANRLARERREDVQRLVGLGQELREAQDQLDAGQLRQLSQQRHQVVSALVGQARQLVAEGGGSAARPAVSESVARELQETLEAAMSDPEAAEALRVGRLTTGISYSGLGLDLDRAESVAAPPRAGRRTPAPAKGGSKQELRDARAAAAEAKKALDQATRRARQLADAADRQQRRVGELREQLDEAERDHRRAAQESAEADRAVAAAEADVARAAERVEEAEAG